MIKTITIRTVTPLITGGADNQSSDSPATIRIPSIRGMLRFWTRAIHPNDPHNIESKLWGKNGEWQGIRIFPARNIFRVKTLKFFPHKPQMAAVSAIRENQEFTLSFIINNSHDLMEVQKAVWVWLNLGTLGRRARRGYGSLLWIPTQNDLLDGFISFDPAKDLIFDKNNTTTFLADYLKIGLHKILGSPLPSFPRKINNWFQIYTSDQVFVGRKVLNIKYDNSNTGMEMLLHGVPENKRGLETNELGYGERLASPLFWRLFPVEGDCSGSKGYIPVIVWSPRYDSKISVNSGIDSYLRGSLGINDSLAGINLNT